MNLVQPCFAINWKNSIDNYLEGYHIPVGHPGLLRLVDYKQYVVETSDANVSIARSPMRDKASKNRQERLYQRLVRPMPGLRAPENAAMELHLCISRDHV